jgi:PAS domain S-box-containing protein
MKSKDRENTHESSTFIKFIGVAAIMLSIAIMIEWIAIPQNLLHWIILIGWFTLLVLNILKDRNKLILEAQQELILRKKAEEIIRKKEHQISSILDLSFGFIGQLTTDGILLYVNQAALEFAGIKSEDAIGKPFWETPWWSHSSEMREILKKALRKAATNEPMRFEATHLGVDNTLHMVDFSLKPLKDNTDTVTLLIAEGRDITKWKQAEDAFLYESQFNKAIIDASPAYIGAIKTNGKTMMMNHAMLNALGYTLDEVIDKNYLDTFIPAEDRNNLSHVFYQLTKELKTTVIENRILTKDGRSLDVKWRGAPIKGTDVDFVIGIGMDNTDCKIALKKLKVSEEKFRLLFENMSNGFSLSELVFDNFNNIIDIKILEINEIAAKCFNLKCNEIINKTIKELTSSFNVDKHKNTIHVALTGEPTNFEMYNDVANIYIHVYMYSPQKYRTAFILEDITNQKKAEIAKRESDEKYSRIVNTANEGILMVDKNINLTFVNAQLYAILGYRPEEMIGQRLENFFYEDDLADHKQKVENRMNGIIERFERRFRKNDGSIICFWASVTPIIDNEKGFQGSFAMLTNITERKIVKEKLKKSELLLKRIVDSSPNIIYIYELPAYKTIFVNKNILQTLGYTTEQFQAMKIEDFKTIIHPDDLPFHIKHHVQLCSLNESEVLESQYRVKHANGQWRWLQSKDVLFSRSYNGKSVQILGIAMDITQQKESEKKILSATIEAEERERNYFARELHDGLGPLLSSIKLHFQWLNRSGTLTSREEILSNVDVIINEAIMSLKEISYRLSPHLLTDFGLIFAIKSFIDKLKGTTPIQIKLESNIEQRLGKDIEITLYRVIIECINNTLKYANAKNISIILIKNIDQITFEYIDDGIGFDYSQIVKSGKGLGLFNMQNRISSLDGHIVIDTQPTKGIKIKVSINA